MKIPQLLGVILLLFVFIGSVAINANAQVNNNTDTSSSSSQINSQLAQLNAQEQTIKLKKQQLVHEAHLSQINQAKQQAEFRKNTLATEGLPTPSLPATQYDKIKACNPNQTMPAINSTAYNNWWKTYLTDFHCGHVLKTFPGNHTALREFKLIADDNQGFGNWLAITKNATDPVMFQSWHFNNSVPAPTLRMTQGDHIKLTVINSNNSKFPHSLHMHSIHAGPMDGMQGFGGSIAPGQSFTYEFIARPYGLYPYHCHMEPVEQHIQHGLYGVMIIDPPTPRPQMKEMVMMMNGFSFNQQNIAHPNNDAPKMLLPPTAQALREGTADVGTTAVKTDTNTTAAGNDNTGTPSATIPKVLGEVPAGTKSTMKSDVALNSDDPKSATIKNQDKALSDGKDKGDDKGKVPDAAGMPEDKANTNGNANDDNNNPEQAKDDPLDPGGGEAGNDNQFYAVNSKAFGYTSGDMIKLTAGKPVRIYLANIVEFDPMNSFHLHGDMFTWNPSGTAMQGRWTNDIIELGQGDRGIMELQFHLPGQFMFHAHINRFTNLGWLGMFNVVPSSTNSTGLAPNARQ